MTLPETESRPAKDERMWAAAAHASVLFSVFGVVIAGLIWSLQRRKSTYAAFQALQAMGYQVIMYTLLMLIGLILPFLMIPVVFAEIALAARNGLDGPYFPFLASLGVWGVVLGSVGVFVLLGLVAAVSCLTGRPFRYPLFGSWLARFVKLASGPDGLSVDAGREDQWAAAMAHATVIVPIWGAVLPLVIWLLERGRSAYLRFQALQALVYQALGVVAMLVFYFLYIGGFMLVTLTAIISTSAGSDSRATLVPVILFFILAIFIILFMLLVPLFQILGQWAAIRILRGHDYGYPLLGRWLRSRLYGGRETVP